MALSSRPLLTPDHSPPRAFTAASTPCRALQQLARRVSCPTMQGKNSERMLSHSSRCGCSEGDYTNYHNHLSNIPDVALNDLVSFYQRPRNSLRRQRLHNTPSQHTSRTFLFLVE
ncbi:hypothetical protein FOXG_22861 [Fusarium oxysporum f. sp. lycopersici 4287]|uniref:Uncharacterized protein n=1 Tax=Fusarium oxysporum f. sp. lycopersici (strain 4287 / CBS 123668 / FGSC 9935 / NRRL 34936) TaxID=426428 RepID=A0A0J9WW27_FUSO4|nr:uncharacterized protein FOXG_22861 [Fusarium oxysporum f. sp. lycopersici 4287]KNB20552.1 hypothetical protein FOXG_22861 [Fusarium oxysporum f. sp. lycopersici 4287]